MGRDIRGHTNGDTCGAVDQKVGITAWQYHRLFFRLVKVGHKIHSVLIDICQQFHGNFGQTGFCVTHGCGAVAVHGTEVAVTVHQRIAGRPFLGHIYQSAVDGTVAVGVIFTHGVTYDTGALSMGFVRPVV